MSITGAADGEAVEGRRRAGRRDRRARRRGLDPRRAARRASAAAQGQRIEIDLLSSALAALVNQASGYLNAGAVPRRLGNDHPSIEPFATYARRRRPADDLRRQRPPVRGAGAGARRATSWPPTRASRPTRRRVEHRAALRELIEARLATAPVADWVERLRAAGVPAGPVNDVAAAFELAESLGLEPVDEHDGRAHRRLAARACGRRRRAPAADRRSSTSTAPRSAPGSPAS